MDPKTRKQIGLKLEAELRNVETSLKANYELLVLSHVEGDEIERRMTRDEKDNLGQINNKLKDKQRLILLALERSARGTLGSCEECGEDISPKRLVAIPWADLCIQCKEDAEQKKTTGAFGGIPDLLDGGDDDFPFLPIATA